MRAGPGFGRMVAARVLIAMLAIAFASPGGASAATLAQVRSQLLAWHLRPAPLFPSQVPAGFGGASVALGHRLDFDIEFAKNTPSGQNYFSVAFRRGDAALLSAVLHDPGVLSARLVQIGIRSVYSIQTGHSAAPSLLAWNEQDHT